MEGFFKLIFYIIIITFWVLSNLKKQTQWEEKIPDFSKDSPPPKKNIPQMQSHHDEPLREGDSDNEQTETSEKEAAPSPSITFDQYLKIREQQELKNKQRKGTDLFEPTLVETEDSTQEEGREEEIKPQIIMPVLETEDKPALPLNSSIKEGIIWSIILGPPRAKKQFDWNNIQLMR